MCRDYRDKLLAGQQLLVVSLHVEDRRVDAQLPPASWALCPISKFKSDSGLNSFCLGRKPALKLKPPAL